MAPVKATQWPQRAGDVSALALSGLLLAYPPTTPGRLISRARTLSQPGRGLHLSIHCVDVTSSVVLLSASNGVGSYLQGGNPCHYQRHKTYLTRLSLFPVPSHRHLPFSQDSVRHKVLFGPFLLLDSAPLIYPELSTVPIAVFYHVP